LWRETTNSNLLDLPESIVTTDGGGTLAAETDYSYDNGGCATSASGVTTQHISPPNAACGNLTTVTRVLKGGANPVTKTAWNDAGEPVSTTDPRLNTTTFSYGQCAGSVRTQTTDALTHFVTGSYDCNTGLLTSFSDENSQSTTYTYDAIGRLTGATFADAGKTTYCNTDTGGSICTKSGPPYEIVTTKTISSSLNETQTTVYDGLGRVSQTQLNSDSPSTTYTLTTYDVLGRKFQVYNPTRCSTITTNCGEATWGYTTYSYDALGRTTNVTHPDKTFVATSYTGRATDVVDEGNGNTSRPERVSQVDGLGRLVSVCEVTSTPQLGPGGSPAACSQDINRTGFLTTYGYDALGNLLIVTQGSLSQRTFAYDSLSHLLCAANPETGGSVTCPTPDTGSYTPGTTRYAYDANSNLFSRVRPAPNQTSLSTTDIVTYGYDGLNRLTQQTYSDGVTPTVMFGYDQTSISMTGQTFSIANNIGRLSWAAPVNSSGYPIQMKAFSYDAMGRVAELWQKNPVNNNALRRNLNK
jgi:YD repeat-containing protein